MLFLLMMTSLESWIISLSRDRAESNTATASEGVNPFAA